MPEESENNVEFPRFTNPIIGDLKGVLDNDTTTSDEMALSGLGMKKRSINKVICDVDDRNLHFFNSHLPQTPLSSHMM